MSKTMQGSLQAAAQYIKQKYPHSIDLGLILGSGLGPVAEQITDSICLAYEDIPHFPVSTVEGHAGQLVIGQMGGKTVLAMQGRFHSYEGHHMNEVVFPIRVMHLLGIEALLVTNAAGGVQKEYFPGDLMVIEDHINLFGTNPLIGENLDEVGTRFPDMSVAYDQEYRDTIFRVALESGIYLQSGVYAGTSGPMYETPAEVKMIRTLGADAIGMSTVPEVIVANHAQMRVLGISCITNMASGILPEPLTHKEVVATAERVRGVFSELLIKTIEEIDCRR